MISAAELMAAAARRAAKTRNENEKAVDVRTVPSSSEPERAPAPTGTDTQATESAVPTTECPAPAETPTTHPHAAQIAKYKRMLKAGVPLPSVLRKMGEDAFDVALFTDHDIDAADVDAFYRPAFIAVTQPRPAVPPRASTSMSLAHDTPAIVRKKLHLVMIPKPKATLRVATEKAPATTSVWCCDLPRTLIAETTYALLDAHATKPAATTVKPATVGKETATSRGPPGMSNSLIDQGRAQNIAILLVGMKLSTDEWRECVLNLSFNENFSENLKMLLVAWPTGEEARAIAAYNGDGTSFGRAEDFFVGLRDIPRLKQKMECLRYRVLFSSRVFELRESMVLVVRGINQIVEKKKFAAVLRHIFDLVCVMRDGRGALESKGHDKGFRVSALTQLLCEQSFVPGVSILRVLAEALELDDPCLGTFAQELTLLKICAAVSVEALRSELTSLEGGYKTVASETESTAKVDLSVARDPKLEEGLRNFQAIADNFAGEAELELQGLRENWCELDDARRRLNLFLEEPEDTPFGEVITHIAVFVEAFATERAKILGQASKIKSPESLASDVDEDLEQYFSPPSSQTSDSTPYGSDDQIDET